MSQICTVKRVDSVRQIDENGECHFDSYLWLAGTQTSDADIICISLKDAVNIWKTNASETYQLSGQRYILVPGMIRNLSDIISDIINQAADIGFLATIDFAA